MKKIFTLVFAALALIAVSQKAAAQTQVQLHYDFGHLNKNLKDRQHITTTVEHFSADNWGSNFFFIDMDYKDQGVASAYWEVARELRFWKCPISLHLEYDGGLSNMGSYSDAYLVGPAYNWNNKDYSAGLSFQAMYKHLAKADKKSSFQLTGVWYRHFNNRLFSFNGFADFWVDRAGGKSYGVFITEPQFWVNLNRIQGVNPKLNLSLGTEWEISYNFPYNNEKFYVLPTLAAKWTF